ncbi:RNA polymerase factor sigma-54 [Terriglobus tenax]|uniref:RNA polymerase factor sigma-54 n=1 Tax=Terriglobus tenax TaxID=1111115 RepID=UPI0021E08004|nr:RNA polymerase factor sigma-54 [Terriglobus tenax]
MLLQPKLNVKISQRQVLTPGLMQMVSVLALNKLELKEMINTEIIENPVLEEIEISDPTFEELAGREGDRELSAEEATHKDEKDPFEEIDFGSYFQEYLDPGFRTGSSSEELDKPSFENFLSQPSTLTDHLHWQLGAMTLPEDVRAATELIVGNLDENGYLSATDEELLAALRQDGHDQPETLLAAARKVIGQLDPAGVGSRDLKECLRVQLCARQREAEVATERRTAYLAQKKRHYDEAAVDAAIAAEEAEAQEAQHRAQVMQTADLIVDKHLALLQKKDMRELVKECAQPQEIVQEAVDLIRTLDPRPGQRYNQAETRLIEPDVAFVKRGDEYVVAMNEEDMPSLRLNAGYRRMMHQKDADRDLKEYVKERYRSAIQLLRNIEQRKNTIVRTCEAIVRRQQEFLEKGLEGLRPMMIKEVAEEIGVHPSTVSRAVSNKYVHTPQGVYELRFFFSEGVNGPEGGDLPLVLLKRKVKKLIDDEDPRQPYTDDYLAAELQRQGIQITRRTVAKYREEMQIPSTHKRRVR